MFPEFDSEFGEMCLDVSQDTGASVHSTYRLQPQVSRINLIPQGTFIQQILCEKQILIYFIVFSQQFENKWIS